MNTLSRRGFLKTTAALASAAALPGIVSSCGQTRTIGKGGKMTMRLTPRFNENIHVFNISGFSRTGTASIIVEIDYEGFTGYGEAALPPYMTGQTVETATAFLEQVDLSQFSSPFLIDDILTYVDGIAPGMSCAKCGVDIALHDLIGKLLNAPLYSIWGYNPDKSPCTSYTIGMDTKEMIIKKTLEAEPYKILKVKLGSTEENDKMIVNTIREVTDKPMVVDANQGWKDKHYALDMIHWLKEKGIQMAEQPMPKTVYDEMAWVTENSPLPTYGDESCQRLSDVTKLHGVFDGINIKLIKCTGLREANKMITTARALGMNVMIGCTGETSVACSAAAQVSPMVDFADIDGCLLISNDPFTGMKVIDGKITLNDLPGIGATKL